ncbi:hypothetical protein CCP3SC15_4910002 [Gammaproteobacteria bacterium]
MFQRVALEYEAAPKPAELLDALKKKFSKFRFSHGLAKDSIVVSFPGATYVEEISGLLAEIEQELRNLLQVRSWDRSVVGGLYGGGAFQVSLKPH